MKTFNERLQEIKNGTRPETYITQLKRAGENAIILDSGETVIDKDGITVYPKPVGKILVEVFAAEAAVGTVEETGDVVTLGPFVAEYVPPSAILDISDSEKEIQSYDNRHELEVEEVIEGEDHE